MTQTFLISAAKDNAQEQLNSGLSASGTVVQLKSGGASKFPSGNTGSATSLGDETTLNSTGIGAKIQVGDFIQNTTDGSFAFVVSKTTDAAVTTKLIGGTANIWDASDEWVVGAFYATLSKKDSEGNDTTFEIVRVDYVNSSNDQVVLSGRGEFGTTPTAFSADDYFSLYTVANDTNSVRKALAELFDRKADSVDAMLQSIGTTAGDVVYFNGTSWVRLGIGSNDEVLTVSGGVPVWAAAGGSPTTTEGDLIVRGASADERLAIGTSGQVLTSNGTTATWETPSVAALDPADFFLARATTETTSVTGNTHTDTGLGPIQILFYTGTTDSFFGTSVNDETNNRIEILKTGDFILSFTATVRAPAYAPQPTISIIKNGATTVASRTKTTSSTAAEFNISPVTVSLVAGDLLTVQITHTNSAHSSEFTVAPVLFAQFEAAS